MSFIEQDISKIKDKWFDETSYKFIANYDTVLEVAEDYNLKSYTIIKVMEDKDEFYVCGSFCVVRNLHRCLTLYHSKHEVSDVFLTESYLNAKYYKLSDLNNI